MDLKASLKGRLKEQELAMVSSSFDIVGDIAILEIPKELEKKETMIAETLLKLNKNIKTVCKKAGDRYGKYRLRKYKKILGDGFGTIHKESGCQFKLDIRKAYFSVRESTERLRIASQIKPKERVLILFSGIGPFGIIIAKNHPECEVDMAEINPKACEYAEENIRINKVGDRVNNYCGDIQKTHKSLGKYDKIIMPLPEKAYKFLDIAIQHCERKGIIYLYAIEGRNWSEDRFPSTGKHKSEIEKTLKSKKLKIIQKRQVLPYAPGVWKVCFEVRKI